MPKEIPEVEFNEDDVIEVTWSGKKVLIPRKELDDWYNMSFEDHDYYIETHPWVEQPIELKDFGKHKKKDTVDLSKFVIVHFGRKSVLLPRKDLGGWNTLSPEEKRDYIQEHPDMLVDKGAV